MNLTLSTLQELTEGLLYMSESDFPVKPIWWLRQDIGADDLTVDRLLAFTGHPSGLPVETVDFYAFFEPAIQPEAWHSDEERESVRRFQALMRALAESLTDLVVYKVGVAQKDVYVIGKTPDGDFAGVTTKVVET